MKKKKHDDEHPSEAWLLPYSDLMTLLLAVFIVLFAVSKIDQVKADALSAAFNSIFSGGAGVFDESQSEFNNNDPSGIAEQNATADPLRPYPQDGLNKEGDNTELLNQERMKALDHAFETYFEEHQEIGEYSIKSSPGMITITLDADVLFPPGQAELNENEKVIARSLAEIIYDAQELDFPLQVVISGHTDTVPVNRARYASNWELSLDRASNFTFAMLEGSRLDPRMFHAVGHGELDPIDTNDTPEGRARNRRVEISIISQEVAGQDFSTYFEIR